MHIPSDADSAADAFLAVADLALDLDTPSLALNQQKETIPGTPASTPYRRTGTSPNADQPSPSRKQKKEALQLVSNISYNTKHAPGVQVETLVHPQPIQSMQGMFKLLHLQSQRSNLSKQCGKILFILRSDIFGKGRLILLLFTPVDMLQSKESQYQFSVSLSLT